MTVQGKGYLHPNGKVAVSRLRLVPSRFLLLLVCCSWLHSQGGTPISHQQLCFHACTSLLPHCRRLDDLLEYVPTGPAERVVCVNYDAAAAKAAEQDDALRRSSGSRVAVPLMRLVPELRAAAWSVTEEEEAN